MQYAQSNVSKDGETCTIYTYSQCTQRCGVVISEIEVDIDGYPCSNDFLLWTAGSVEDAINHARVSTQRFEASSEFFRKTAQEVLSFLE